jgi:hypothetical protein|tara:strand:- start:50 stop:277 length:228 start_codon:yes stop_codon:yes gene_type:complete
MPKHLKVTNANKILLAQQKKLDAYNIIISAAENVKLKINSDSDLEKKKLWEMLRFLQKEIEVIVYNLDIVMDEKI